MYLGSLVPQGIRSSFFGSHRHCTRQHYHIPLLEKYFPRYKNFTPFTIIRDPWHRTCSEYIWIFRNKKSWSEFDGWLLKYLTIYRHNQYVLDNHLRPQVEFINDEITVFLQHRHHEAEEFVNDALGHTFDFSVKEKKYDYDCPSISSLSQETRDLWENIYAQDLELFNRLK